MRGFRRWYEKGLDQPMPSRQEIEETELHWEEDMYTMLHEYRFLKDSKEFMEQF